MPAPITNTQYQIPKMSFFKKFFTKEKEQDLDQGLEKTKTGFFDKLSKAVAGKSTVDVEVLDELENILITSDVGLETAVKIINRIEDRVKKDKYLNTSELDRIMRDEIVQLLEENNTGDTDDFLPPPGKKPYVLLVVGVNGVGKTTTIGKLVKRSSLVLGTLSGLPP
jgi:fused signal recognition particle receptor